MVQVKRNHDPAALRRCWRGFIPLTVALALMVRFPLRIVIGEAFWDTLFYGLIVALCAGTAVHVYRRYGRSYRLIGVALLCAGLAGWQIVDLTLLRYEQPDLHPAGAEVTLFAPLRHGWVYYNQRFAAQRGGCGGYILERYFGNTTIAIVYDTDRQALWMGCGG